MAQIELVKTTVEVLDSLGIPYALTGSIASSFYGEPRSTHDIDVIVVLRLSDVEKLARSFDPNRFYVDEEAIREAIAHQGVFNLIDQKTGFKVDFWILKDDLYYQVSFQRRVKQKIDEVEPYLLAPEDVILSKLLWYRISGGSERQLHDALGVYLIQAERLNMEYIRKWAGYLEVQDLLDEIIERSKEV